MRSLSEGKSGQRAHAGVTSLDATRSVPGDRHVTWRGGGTGLRECGSLRGSVAGYWGVGVPVGLGREYAASPWSCGCLDVFWGPHGAGKGVRKWGSHEAEGARACCAQYSSETREKEPGVSVPGGAVFPPTPPPPFYSPLADHGRPSFPHAGAGRGLGERLRAGAGGEHSRDSRSGAEGSGGGVGDRGGGGRGQCGPDAAARGVQGGPSLLQQRLGAGEGRLRGAMAEALGHSFSGAARLLEGLGGPLGHAQAGAAATAHCLCLVRRDVRAVAATVATITACHLLPDIRGEL